MLTNKKISVVVICYMDEPTVPIMYERLTFNDRFSENRC